MWECVPSSAPRFLPRIFCSAGVFNLIPKCIVVYLLTNPTEERDVHHSKFILQTLTPGPEASLIPERL
jgi:hypothetical protein